MRRRSLVLALLVAGLVLALLATGCGGSSSGVASVATSAAAAATATTPQGKLVAYAQCMRAHGETGFPDPVANGIPKLQVVPLQRADPAKFDAADGACHHLLPGGSLGAPPLSAQQIRTRVADGLSFARCMRSHGVAHFPDPNSQGQLTVAMVSAAGVDFHSPAVLRTVYGCLPASHGMLTHAMVEHALHETGG